MNNSFSNNTVAEEKFNTLSDMYLGHEKTKLEKLEDIEKEVTRNASIPVIIIGIISALVAGAGMSFAMTLGAFIIGIPVGIIGFIGMAITWPLYKSLVKKGRNARAKEVEALART